MEDEKRKKRNKKKKNKQNKASEDDAPAVAGDHHIGNGGNDHEPAGQNGAAPNADANAVPDVHRDNGFDEAVLKDEISRLHKENEAHLRKEADLEEKIKELQYQNESHVQKQASLEDAIKALIRANDISVMKEADFEEKVNQLSIEKDSYIQKQADLEMKIAELQHEKDLWLEKESSSKGTLEKQNVDITRLKMQVVELEENKSSLLKEKQVLAERTSDLQSRILALETIFSSTNTSELSKNPPEDDKVNSQIEAAHALVNKLITENAELVEKVNELYVKLDQKSAELEPSSGSESDVMVGSTEILDSSVSPADSVKNIPAFPGKLDSIEVGLPVVPIAVPSEADSAEIVQIPLDETEDEHDYEPPQDVERDDSGDDDSTPLSDAPLIGAPFRLLSFVASYVSGADLVNTQSAQKL